MSDTSNESGGTFQQVLRLWVFVAALVLMELAWLLIIVPYALPDEGGEWVTMSFIKFLAAATKPVATDAPLVGEFIALATIIATGLLAASTKSPKIAFGTTWLFVLCAVIWFQYLYLSTFLDPQALPWSVEAGDYTDEGINVTRDLPAVLQLTVLVRVLVATFCAALLGLQFVSKPVSEAPQEADDESFEETRDQSAASEGEPTLSSAVIGAGGESGMGTAAFQTSAEGSAANG